jgi:uncharacterized protein
LHRVTDVEVLNHFPAAPIDHDNIAYYRGLLERRLLINHCADCGQWSQPPRGMCPSCWSDSVVPEPISGSGTIHLLILLHQGPLADGVDYTPAYPVAVIELAEQPGLRLTATLEAAAVAEGAWNPQHSPIPLKLSRPPRLLDSAMVALFLASDESAYMSGVIIPATDGGTLSRVAMGFDDGWEQQLSPQQRNAKDLAN